MSDGVVRDWLPAGRIAAVALSVDDLHPTPHAPVALEHLAWLQERHPALRVTFFTTPDWRSVAPFPTRSLVARVPVVRDRVHTVPRLPRGTYRLDRHEWFCAMLRDWPRAEVALHGLHHTGPGRRPVVEFAERSERACRSALEEGVAILETARLPVEPGLCPPGWEAPAALIAAMASLRMRFLASARDLTTPISTDATATGSGLQGVSLLRPHRIAPGLVHFSTNFQATSTADRALDVIAAGGLLAIKAHLMEGAGTYRALDALTQSYREHLHAVLSTIEERYGDAIWWTSMGEIARRCTTDAEA